MTDCQSFWAGILFVVMASCDPEKVSHHPERSIVFTVILSGASAESKDL